MAKCAIAHGVTSVIRHMKGLDSTATDGSGKTGLAFGDITAKYVKPGGTLTALTAETVAVLGTYAAPTSNAHIRFKELANADPTKGVYEVHFHNDWLASGEMFTLFLSAAGMADLALEVQLGPVQADATHISGDSAAADNLESACDNYSVTRGLTGTALPAVAADGVGGIPISDAGGLDLDAILADTNELQADNVPGLIAALENVSSANVQTAANAALVALKLDHLVAVADADDVVDDSVLAKMAATDGDWSNFAKATDALQALRDRGDAAWTTGAGYAATGTAQAGAASTITLAAGASAVNNFYSGRILLTGGTGAGQSRGIISYVGATKVLTVDRAWATNPDATSDYEIQGADVSLAAATANKIADHVIRRSFQNACDSADGDAKSFRSLLGAIAKLVNKFSLSGTTLTITEDDDTTTLGTQTVTKDATAEPITAVDTV